MLKIRSRGSLTTWLLTSLSRKKSPQLWRNTRVSYTPPPSPPPTTTPLHPRPVTICSKDGIMSLWPDYFLSIFQQESPLRCWRTLGDWSFRSVDFYRQRLSVNNVYLKRQTHGHHEVIIDPSVNKTIPCVITELWGQLLEVYGSTVTMTPFLWTTWIHENRAMVTLMRDLSLC